MQHLVLSPVLTARALSQQGSSPVVMHLVMQGTAYIYVSQCCYLCRFSAKPISNLYLCDKFGHQLQSTIDIAARMVRWIRVCCAKLISEHFHPAERAAGVCENGYLCEGVLYVFSMRCCHTPYPACLSAATHAWAPVATDDIFSCVQSPFPEALSQFPQLVILNASSNHLRYKKTPVYDLVYCPLSSMPHRQKLPLQQL